MHELAVGYAPTVIPAINREQWVELASLAANFNQIMARINRTNTIDKEDELIRCIKRMDKNLIETRKALIGMR